MCFVWPVWCSYIFKNLLEHLHIGRRHIISTIETPSHHWLELSKHHPSEPGMCPAIGQSENLRCHPDCLDPAVLFSLRTWPKNLKTKTFLILYSDQNHKKPLTHSGGQGCTKQALFGHVQGSRGGCHRDSYSPFSSNESTAAKGAGRGLKSP